MATQIEKFSCEYTNEDEQVITGLVTEWQGLPKENLILMAEALLRIETLKEPTDD